MMNICELKNKKCNYIEMTIICNECKKKCWDKKTLSQTLFINEDILNNKGKDKN